MKKIFYILIFSIFILSISGCSKKSEYYPGINDIQSCENSVEFWIKDELRVNPNLNIDKFRNEILNKHCGEEVLSNAKILTKNGYKKNVEYTWNGKLFTGGYNVELRPAVEWIKNNIEDDAKITSWWDFGDMIRAISKRDVVLYGPSKEFVKDYNNIYAEWRPNFNKEDYMDHEILLDVSNILISQNPSDSIKLMSKYNSKYLLVSKKDSLISNVINRWVEGQYINPSQKSILFLAVNKENIEGFNLLYSDNYTAIYKVFI